MKLFKCTELIYPGRTGRVLLFILLIPVLYLPVRAQGDSLQLSFSDGRNYLIAQNWDETLQPFRQPVNADQFEKKSPSRAFFYSLLLPGMGEAYVGEEFQSRLFLGLELVGWGFVVANIINVNMRENDYRNYAVEHAQVVWTAKENQYWIDIAKYDDIFDYNEQRRRDRDLNALYPENALYSWQWDATANRLSYDAYRIETREIENPRLYYFAAIALNHLVSAINALRVANAYNRKAEDLSFNFNFDYNPDIGQFTFSLQKSF
jgi:hypothetical protein